LLGNFKARDIIACLNKRLNDNDKNDPTKFITKRHVQAIRKQFYTPNIIDVEQLNQPPLRPSFFDAICIPISIKYVAPI
jgi:hypothetical protein